MIRRTAISQMLSAIILISIAIAAGILVYHAVLCSSSRLTGGAGVSISGASLSAIPGGAGYLTLNVVNTGGATGTVSVELYSGGSEVFSAPGAPGLIYQIYYGPSPWHAPPADLVYRAPLSRGSSFSSGGLTWTASSGPWTTSVVGSERDVDGRARPNVIDDMRAGYPGGAPFPDPPVSNGYHSYAIKEIGYVVVTEPTSFYVDIDDGGILGISRTGGSETSWLGGSSNIGNLIDEWRGEGATLYSSPTVDPGTYRVEYDWFNGGGPAYWSLWTSSTVYYYHPVNLSPGSSISLDYVVPPGSGVSPGDSYTVVVRISTPQGTAIASVTLTSSP